MLNKSPINRLCKFSQIKNDPWFNNFSFEDLLSLNMKPPYIPILSLDSYSKSSKSNDSHSYAYINYIKTIKDYTLPKDFQIEKNKQTENDKWFKNF